MIEKLIIKSKDIINSHWTSSDAVSEVSVKVTPVPVSPVLLATQ